jgi:hypothetical protein
MHPQKKCYAYLSVALITLGIAGLLWGAVSYYQAPLLLGKNISLLAGGSLLVIAGIVSLFLGQKREIALSSKKSVSKSKKPFKPYPWDDHPKKIKDREALKRIRKLEKHSEYPFSDRVLYPSEARERLNILYRAKDKPKILKALSQKGKKTKKKTFNLYPWNDLPQEVTEEEALKRMQQLERTLGFPYNIPPITNETVAHDLLIKCYGDKQLVRARERARLLNP